MQTPLKRLWLQEGWNWIDRAFFYAATAIALATALGFLLWLLRPASWGPEAWSAAASWIQAVGSISAIVFGFVIVRFQLSEQRRDAIKIEEERQRAAASRAFQFLKIAVSATTIQIRGINSILAEKDVPRHNLRIACSSLLRLFEFPQDAAVRPAMLMALSVLQTHSRTILELARLLESCTDEEAAHAIQLIRDGINKIETELRKCLTWIDSELNLTLSQDERDQIERMAPHFSKNPNNSTKP